MLGDKGTPFSLKRAVVRLEKIDNYCINDDGFSSDVSGTTSVSERSSPLEEVGKRGRKRRCDFNDSGGSDLSEGRVSVISLGSSSSAADDDETSRASPSDSSDDSGSPRRRSKRPKLYVVPPESLFERKKRPPSSLGLDDSFDRSGDIKSDTQLDRNLNDARCSDRNYAPTQRCRDCRQLKNDNPDLKFFPGDSDDAVRLPWWH